MVRREKEEMRVKEQPVWEHAGKLKLWLTPGGVARWDHASSFPNASHAYCSSVLLPFPFGSQITRYSSISLKALKSQGIVYNLLGGLFCTG
jgi:hypothetical protein